MSWRIGTLPISFATILLPALAIGQPRIDEAVVVQNYRRAPLVISLKRTWVDDKRDDEWVSTCFEYEIRNRTRHSYESYSYEMGPTATISQQASVFGGSQAPLPGQSLTRQACVANRRSVDEGTFTFRLIFVESHGHGVWESRSHRKAVKALSSHIH